MQAPVTQTVVARATLEIARTTKTPGTARTIRTIIKVEIKVVALSIVLIGSVEGTGDSLVLASR